MEGSLARALYSFQSSNPEELSVPEGGIIRIAQYIDKNWLEAEYQGRRGFFPVTYAVRLENEPQLYNNKIVSSNGGGRQEDILISSDEFYRHDGFSERQDTSGRSFVEAAFGFVARNESELTFPTGALLEVTKDVDDDWLEGSFNGRTGLFPKSYIKSSETPRARAIYPFVGESVGELTFREGDCIFLRKRLNSQWMEGEINGNVGLFPSSFVAVEVDLPPEEGKFVNNYGDFSFMDSTPKDVEGQRKGASSKIQWKKGMKGKALFHFSALYSGDLELNKGDIITVLGVEDENWLEGQSANGVSGSCPMAYLEPIYYDTSRQSENEQWSAGNQLRFSSHENVLGVNSYSYFPPNAGTNDASKYSSQVFFSQQDDIFGSHLNTESTGRTLFDSSFTQDPDPTPTLMPFNASSMAQHPKTQEKMKPMLNFKPIVRSKPTEGYSLTYLGSEDTKNLSAPKSYQAVISPSTSIPSLSNEIASFGHSYESRPKIMAASNGVSRQSHTIGQSSSTSYFYDSVGTWPSKRKGLVAEENRSNRKHLIDDDDDDLLSGNCTSLPSPLLPLSQRRTDDDNTESSASEDSPITPRRPAPPPPKRNTSNMHQVRSSTLPATRSRATPQDRYSQEVLPSKAKGDWVSGVDNTKLIAGPHASSPTATKRGSSLSPKGSPKMRSAVSVRNEPQSLHWKERVADSTTEKSPPEVSHLNSLKHLSQVTTASSSVATITGSDSGLFNVKNRDGNSGNREESEVPGLESLQDRITEAEQNLKKEINVHAGFKSIAQLVMTDPVKQREMEVKVSQSQQKISEWQEELKHLKDEKVFLIEAHRKKMLKNKIAHLEADLEKQARSQRSLEMLLGVVEENRKKEVMENLGVCAQVVEKIRRELTELEASLHCLTEKPAASSQKHMAEQRQRVVTELVNTERDYCNDLDLCVKYFLCELQSAQVKDLDCEGLFGNIESVLETSKKLLESLEGAIEHTEGNEQELGKCFMDIAEEMKEVYAVYCRNHDDAISLMEKYEEMPEIQDVFSKCLEKIREHTRCWDLSSFLIKPVQRVLKYPLLLNELLKYTPEIHRDKYNLIQAISVMTDVANAINEFKRRKDLVIKYKKVEDSGLTNMIQKLNWHSVVKKSTRINQRLTQRTGLVPQTVDEKFIEEEKKFRGIEKTVKVLCKNISTYLEEFQEAMECGQASGGNVSDFYQDAATCTEVSTFHKVQKTIGETILIRFMDTVQVQVLSPLNSLLSLFQGPQRLIQKRNDKCLDYDRWSNKIDKIKDRDKLKAAKEELELAKKNYEALNTQLLEEIPDFTEKCMVLVVDCLKNFAMAQNRLYYEIQKEYEQLLQLSIVQTVEGDIVEQHSRRSLQVMEQFSDLSFIPCSFVAKDSSRKKRRSLKSPPATHEPDTAEDDKGFKPNLVDYRDVEEGGMGRTNLAPPPPSSVLHPRPAPRRMSSTTRSDPKNAGSRSTVEVTPGELHIVDFRFEAQNAGELSVSEGDLVSVLRNSDTSGNPEWWLIQCNGATGYVPQSFLSPVSDNQDDVEGDGDVVNGVEDDAESSNRTKQDANVNTTPVEDSSESTSHDTNTAAVYYCAEFAFEANSAAELSLEEGQFVAVLQKRDLTGNDEWWLVDSNDQKGYVPSSYLSPVGD